MTAVSGRGCDRVLVFVPSYNDTEQLAAIIAALIDIDDAISVLVLDDGSVEPIKASIAQSNCMIFRLPTNFGLGVCTQIAFDHALQHDYDAIVRVDADGQHPLEAILALLEPLRNDSADVVVATRSNRHQGYGFRAVFSRLARGYLSLLARLLTNGRAPADVNSGFFAASRAAVKTLNVHQLERFPEPQVYVLACRSGLRISSMAVEQMQRMDGTSSVTVSHGIRLAYRFSIFALSELMQRRQS